MPDISLDVEVKVQNALAEMRRLSPTADKESKAIAGSLGKALKDAEKAAKKASDELDRGMKKSGASVDAAGKAAVKLRGALSSISPAAGGVAGAVDDAADALEAMDIAAGAVGVSTAAAGAALGMVAVVLGAGYLAWVAYNDESSKAAEIAGIVATAERNLAPLIDATRMAQLDAAVATGAMTEEAARLEREGIASMKAFASATADASAQIKALHAGEGTFSRWGADLIEAAQGSALLQFTSLGTVNALAAMTESSSEAQAKIDALMAVEQHAAEITKEGTVARKASAAASAHHAATTVDLTAQLLKEASAAQASADKFAAHLAAVEADAAAADAIVEQSGAFRLSEIEKLQAAEDDAVGRYTASAQAGALSVEHIAAGEATIRGNYQDQITAKLAEESAKRAEIEQAHLAEVAAAQAASTAATLDQINQVSSYASQAVGMATTALDESYANSTDTAQRLTDQLIAGESYYTDAQKAELSDRVEANKDAARKAFYASKAAKMGEAVASSALAVINAIAEVPYPLNIAAGIAAGVAGGVAVGTIASTEPAFHTGYAPDEMRAKVLKSESVLSPVATAAMGAGRVAEVNAGKTGGGYSGPAPVIIDHRTMNTLIKREIANAGALSTALSGGRIVGHRTNRRGTSG
jgi:hypothetical protein